MKTKEKPSKKAVELYETPAIEIIEIKSEQNILGGSVDLPGDPDDGGDF